MVCPLPRECLLAVLQCAALAATGFFQQQLQNLHLTHFVVAILSKQNSMAAGAEGIMGRNVIMIATCLLLSGCVTGAEQQAALNLEHHRTCLSYGAAPGTDMYVACRLQMNGQQRALEAEQRRAVANAFRDIGESLKRKGSHCKSNVSYQTIYTDCTQY